LTGGVTGSISVVVNALANGRINSIANFSLQLIKGFFKLFDVGKLPVN